MKFTILMPVISMLVCLMASSASGAMKFSAEFDALESNVMSREKEVEAFFENLLSRSGDPEEKAAALIGLARINLRRRSLDKAEALLSQILIQGDDTTTEIEALWWLGVINIHKKRPTDALRNFQKGLSLAAINAPDQVTRFQVAINRIVDITIIKFAGTHTEKLATIGKKELDAPEDLFWSSDSQLTVIGKKNQAGTIPVDQIKSAWTLVPYPEILKLGTGSAGKCLFIAKKEIYTETGKLNLSLNPKHRNFFGAIWTNPGEYWVLNRKDETVERFDESGKKTGAITHYRIDKSDLIAADPSGGAWFLSTIAESFMYFNAMGKETITRSLLQGDREIKKAIDLDVDYLGFVYILDESSDSIYIFYPDGAFAARIILKQVIPGLSAPSALAVDREGRIYVTDRKDNAIHRID